MAYLILFYTGLAIVLSVYIFLVLSDWLKRKCLIRHVQNGSVQKVERVLKTGMNMNEKNVFGKTPLMGVVKFAKSPDLLKKILEQSDVNVSDENGITPLMEASAYNPIPEIMQTLIYAGANVHQTSPKGWTALMIAAARNTNPAVVQTLLDAGADINSLDQKQKTPLMYAAEYNPNPMVVQTLLEAGADKTLRSYSGKTAFDYAHENAELFKTQIYYLLEV